MKRTNNEGMPAQRMKRLELSMRNIKDVMKEREEIREDYKFYLENQYAEKQRKILKKEHEEYVKQKDIEPDIT